MSNYPIHLSQLSFLVSLCFLCSACGELGPVPPLGWQYWSADPNIHYAPFRPYDISISPSGKVWVASHSGIFFSDSGLFSFSNPTWPHFDSSNTIGILPPGPYHAIHVAPNSTIWAGGEHGILAAFSNGQWTTFNDFQAQLPLATISVLSSQLNNNKLWVGTDGYGVATLHNGSWTYYSRYWTPQLLNNIINDLVIDKTNVVWIATDSGITKVDGAVWSNYCRENTGGGIPDNRITALAVDSLNQLWAGTYRGYLLKYDGREWFSYAPDSANGKLPGLPILGLAIDASGNKWLGFQASEEPGSDGSRGGGIMKFDGSMWTNFTSTKTISAMPGGNIVDVEIDHRNHKWFAIAGGVTRYVGK